MKTVTISRHTLVHLAWTLVPLAVLATGCRARGETTPEAAREGERQPTAQAGATAQYLANAGVLIVNGETKIVFDPLFRNDFGTYQLLPDALEQALFAGAPPFDGLDAVFISHYHEDHFSPVDVLRLLREQPTLELYAPAQAVSGMRSLADGGFDDVSDRVIEIALEYRDAPVEIEVSNLVVEAVRIPHSGWPERRADVENIAYRVTLDDDVTVLHLGDADTSDEHFAHDAAYWDRRHTHVAFPPYWYFESEAGRDVLEERLKPGHAIGVHVPVEIAKDPSGLAGYDLFVEPGETRGIPE